MKYLLFLILVYNPLAKSAEVFDQDILGRPELIQRILVPFQNQLEELFKKTIFDREGSHLVFHKASNANCSSVDFTIDIHQDRQKNNLQQDVQKDTWVLRNCLGESFRIQFLREGFNLEPLSEVQLLRLTMPSWKNCTRYRMEISKRDIVVDFKQESPSSWSGSGQFNIPGYSFDMSYSEKKTESTEERVFYFPQLAVGDPNWDGYIIARMDLFDSYSTKTYWYNRYSHALSKSGFISLLNQGIMGLVLSTIQGMYLQNPWPIL